MEEVEKVRYEVVELWVYIEIIDVKLQVLLFEVEVVKVSEEWVFIQVGFFVYFKLGY